MLQNTYGAAMGARPMLVVRNGIQNYWMLYTRLGGRHGGPSLERSLTRAGYEEGEQEVIRAFAGGMPEYERMFESLEEAGNIKGENIFGHTVAGLMRGYIKGGTITGEFAKKYLLAPYSSMDDMNRVWAYHWQKMHTAEKLAKFEAFKGPDSKVAGAWAKFERDGLPFYDRVIREEFARIYNKQTKGAALRYIGRQAANESNFIYGSGATPLRLQGVVGRIMGVFGTWPLWAAELYLNRTPKAMFSETGNFMKFWARNAILIGGTANMAKELGVDLWNWIAPLSMFGWAGGPYVDQAIMAREIWTAAMDEKASMTKRLLEQMGRLGFPGQVLLMNDIPTSMAGQPSDPGHRFLYMMMGRPTEEPLWPMKFLYPDDFHQPIGNQLPDSPYQEIQRPDTPPNLGPLLGRRSINR